MSRTRVRSRRIAAAALAAVAISALAGSAWAGGHPDSARDRVVRYTVRPGDTLWAIARQVYGSEADPRPLVEQIARLNSITGAVITPGESILVPQAGA
jgi:nucleoid-associated protein YgaU